MRRALNMFLAKTSRGSIRPLHTSPASNPDPLSVVPRVHKLYADNVGDPPYEIHIANQPFRDSFGCPMDPFVAGKFNLNDKIVGYTDAMVLEDDRTSSVQDNATPVTLSSMSTQRVLHPNILNLAGGCVGNYTILERTDCSFESFAGSSLGRTSLGCYHMVYGIKDLYPTLPSRILQSIIRQHLDVVMTCHKRKIHINNFKGNSFLVYKPLINLSGLTYLSSAVVKVLLRNPLASKATDLEMLLLYLRETVFTPLKLSKVDLEYAFSLSQTEFLLESDYSRMLDSPLFYSPFERTSMVGESKDYLDSKFGTIGAVHFVRRKFPNFSNWYSSFDKEVKMHLRFNYGRHPCCPYGFMSCMRACSQHRAEYASKLVSGKNRNVLGDTLANSGMYFEKMSEGFVSKLYQVMQGLNSKIRL